MDNYYDYCYECTGYGDDYHIEDGDLISNCEDCPYNPINYNDEE